MTENINKMFNRWCSGYGYDEDSDEDALLYREVEKELDILNEIKTQRDTLEVSVKTSTEIIANILKGSKPLEWKLVPGCNATWYADTIVGQWLTWEIGEGYYRPPFGYAGIRVEGNLKAAQDMASEVYRNYLLSAFIA